MKMNLATIAVLCAGLVAGPAHVAVAHCQIPCGIYGDATRFTILEEHIATIEKGMKEIQGLSKSPGENANQLIRWTINKDKHADAFAEIVTQYFLQQRIKPVDPSSAEWPGYVEKLFLCHQMLVTVMKTKQTIDLEHVENLKSLLADFRKAYFTAEDEAHVSEHHAEGSAKD